VIQYILFLSTWYQSTGSESPIYFLFFYFILFFYFYFFFGFAILCPTSIWSLALHLEFEGGVLDYIPIVPHGLRCIFHCPTWATLYIRPLCTSLYIGLSCTVFRCDSIYIISLNTRNKAHHDKIIPNAITIPATINRLVFEHYSAWFSSMIHSPMIWQKRCPPFYKVNYDTVIRPTFSAQAAVIRSLSGSVIGCNSIISPPVLCSLWRGTCGSLGCSISHFSEYYFIYLGRRLSNCFHGTSESYYYSGLAHYFYDLPHPIYYLIFY
jgi:hypothetical protein